MKKLSHKIILFINLIVSFLLVLSVISSHINPSKSWPFAFMGLAFPYILSTNIAFLIYWIIKKKKYFLISFFMILLSWNQLKKFIQLNSSGVNVPKNVSVFKLLSYNVRLFNYYNWLSDSAVYKNIFSFLTNERADFICIQEFLTIDNTVLTIDSIREKVCFTPYIHTYYSHTIPNSRNIGIATFSSFPIVNQGVIEFDNSPNASIFSDIKIKTDTIRIYNTYLQSTHLKRNSHNVFDSIFFNYNNKHLDEIKDISTRLKDAYIKRAQQVDVLSEHIKNCPFLVIVCGDFNDTPVSYTYYKLKKDKQDAFVESGNGTGNTYYGNFPSFRIDYILHDKKIKTFGFTTKRVKWSDHYPISCNFYIPQGNEN